MINAALQLFCNQALAAGAISAEAVRVLMRRVMPDGIASREEADMLIALERAVPGADASFGEFLIAAVVDYAVWGERRTGLVSREAAAWLSASISGRDGPSAVGARIAMEVVREAHASSESLTVFALEANSWARMPAGRPRRSFALAA